MPRKKTTRRSSKKSKGLLGSFRFNPTTLGLVILFLVLASFLYVVLTQAATTVTPRFPGDPNPRLSGKAYWGSSIGGNSSPARHEDPTGVSLSIRRTFWDWNNNRSSMISTIKSDIAANRLPWVSTKTPKWAEVAAGQHDTVLDDMLRKVDATGGPVWLTFFHEPEDDTNSGVGREKCEYDPSHAPCSGTAEDWRNMQKHVRERMNALGTKNIAFAPILMSWTWDGRSNRTPSDYWESGIWDFLGNDHYQDGGTSTIAYSRGWKNFVAFAESKGLPFALAEWGTRGGDAAAAQRMQDFWNWGFANRKDMLAYSYFDSSLNSPNGSWELMGEQLTTFQNILKTDPRVQRVSELGTSLITPRPTVTGTATPEITATPESSSTPQPTITPTPAPTTTPVPPASSFTAPSNLQATEVFPNSIRIGWGPSLNGTGQVGYKVYVNGVKQGTTPLLGYNITGLKSNTTYYVKVKGYDATGNEATVGKSITTKSACFLWWCW